MCMEVKYIETLCVLLAISAVPDRNARIYNISGYNALKLMLAEGRSNALSLWPAVTQPPLFVLNQHMLLDVMHLQSIINHHKEVAPFIVDHIVKRVI